MGTLRIIVPPLLALITVVGIDRQTAHRGLLPPGFRVLDPETGGPLAAGVLRRGLAMTILWAVLWIGVFAPLSSLGLERELDLARLSAIQLFVLHALFVFTLLSWYLLGFVPRGDHQRPREDSWVAQLGLRASNVGRELGIGLAVGVLGWLAVLGVLLAVGAALWWLGKDELVPSEPPDLIPWIAALPIWLRLAVSLSAGVVEEAFFRGFLQPRCGAALSTVLFVLAHASYEQPLMLVGVAVLSVVYAGLVHWRQNIWPAIAAHALFDSIQLLVVIPTALRLLPEQEAGALVPVASIAGVVRAVGGP